jgi:hypothetical protein
VGANQISIFNKRYDGEGIADVGRDISEAFDEDYNEAMKNVTTDEHGIPRGGFVVSVLWDEREDG